MLICGLAVHLCVVRLANFPRCVLWLTKVRVQQLLCFINADESLVPEVHPPSPCEKHCSQEGPGFELTLGGSLCGICSLGFLPTPKIHPCSDLGIPSPFPSWAQNRWPAAQCCPSSLHVVLTTCADVSHPVIVIYHTCDHTSCLIHNECFIPKLQGLKYSAVLQIQVQP